MIITINKEIAPSELVDETMVEDVITDEIDNNLYSIFSDDVADECCNSDEIYHLILKECYKNVIDYLNKRINEMES